MKDFVCSITEFETLSYMQHGNHWRLFILERTAFVCLVLVFSFL